jgi:ABC-type sulfate/molybdate transport systems ATPase subunit
VEPLLAAARTRVLVSHDAAAARAAADQVLEL